MPKFDEVTGKQFLEDYNGKELFKEFIPVIGKMPSIAYVPFHKKQAKDVVGYILGKGYCDQAAADALIEKFNALYGDKELNESRALPIRQGSF